MTDKWDAAGYVASSRYRQTVCEYLDEHGPGLPSGIASETGLAQPHVSRALTELRERDVVELLVPESQQKGRLYDLTRIGETALDRLRNGRTSVDVEVVDKSSFPHETVLDYLEANHPTSVLAVATFDGDVASIHFFDDETQDREQTVIPRLWQASGTEDALTTESAGRHEFTVYGLEKLTLVDVPVGEELHLGVSLDPDADVPLRRFVDDIEAQLRN